MSRLFFLAAVFAVLFLQTANAQAVRPRQDEPVLTNGSVIKLVRGGFSDKAIIAIINTRPTRFDLSTERLIELKKSRVSERIILAMIGREGGNHIDADDDDWSMEDDSFFKGTNRDRADKGAKNQTPSATQPGETNIFGSSGGSSGRVRSRGKGGSADSDTETVGSATVRIIRPPTEANGTGGALKLEKTPTMTNESVAQLVDAGFTEGTIIRRIEQSPVEFDLSDAKLADLRKRRVTETVIAAMRSAMADEGEDGAKRRPAP